MKCYHTLECDTLASIQQETLLWLEQNQTLFETKEFWNTIDSIDFIKQSPSLVKYATSLGLVLRECAILIASKGGAPRHIDQGPVIAKLNIPILNTKDTYTEWYDDQGKQIARVEIDKPVVFNSSIAHQVVIGEQAVVPRVMLACMLIKEPTSYL